MEALSLNFAISGMVFNFETVLPPIVAYPDQIERVLKGRLHEPMTKLKPQGKELDLLLVILPDNNGSLYEGVAHCGLQRSSLLMFAKNPPHIFVFKTIPRVA